MIHHRHAIFIICIVAIFVSHQPVTALHPRTGLKKFASITTLSSLSNNRGDQNQNQNILQVSETLFPTKQALLEKSKAPKKDTEIIPAASKEVKGPRRDVKVFDRTNRIDGFERWVKELTFFKAEMDNMTTSSPPSSALIVELSKELLYSGIPEQCLELYAAYCDLIVDSKQNNITTSNSTSSVVAVSVASFPVAPDTKLIQCATRALIFMGDAKGALKLLQATSRSGLDFDAKSKSLLISDLAECSPEGLQAALRLRTSMKDRREPIHGNAYVGLLRGCWMHGLSPRQRGDSPLLVEAAEEERVYNEEVGNSFRMTPDKAEELALQVAAEYMSSMAAAAAVKEANIPVSNTTVAATNTSTGKRAMEKTAKKNVPMLNEALRILFRVAAMRTHSGVLDSNLEIDQASDRELKAKAGLKDALDLMKKYNLKFVPQIADLLIDECLRIGDVNGVKFVVQRMWSSRLYARTSTYNTLLKRYAENGDGESAYGLVTNVMQQNEETQPNGETYALLLEACMRTEKGRYYAKKVIEELRMKAKNDEGGNGLRKEEFDRLMEIKVLDAEPYWPTMLEMVVSGKQPDDRTVMLLMGAFSRTGDVAGALRLHRLQVTAEGRRRQFRKTLLGTMQTVAEDSKKKSAERPAGDDTMHLPPPSRRSTHCLLEILRDSSNSIPLVDQTTTDASVAKTNAPLAAHEEAMKVLRDMCDRAQEFKGEKQPGDRWKTRLQVLPVTFTASGKLLLADSFSPDQTTFALVMEACIAADDPDNALQVFSQMEAIGLYPDRRVYAALIRSFGLRRDVPSALGVFDEMRRNFTPDVETLNSILEVCRVDPLDLRLICAVLERMADDGCDLEVYSRDILMQGYPDAISLGAALEDMEDQETPQGFECTTASLGVLAVLVQAVRKDGGVSALSDAMVFLGKVGIRPDAETMEYFRIPVAPAQGAPNSRHYHRLLLPHKERVRSLMDLQMPAEYAPENLDLPVSPSAPKAAVEPYFESGQDDWAEAGSVLLKALVGANNDDDDNDDNDMILTQDGIDMLNDASIDVERLLLEGAFDIDEDNIEGEGKVLPGSKVVSPDRRGPGPFGRELIDELDELTWPEEDEAVVAKPLTLLPLEIKESFLSQARPRTKPVDVWTPVARKKTAQDSTAPKALKRRPSQSTNTVPAVKPKPSTTGRGERSGGFDQDLLALSRGGGGGKYSLPPEPPVKKAKGKAASLQSPVGKPSTGGDTRKRR